MKYIVYIIFLFAFCLSGCLSVPKNASILSASVNQGIEKMQIECEAIIKTLGDVERGVLDEDWEDIYRKVEQKYKAAYSLADDHVFTEDERIDIATGAAAVREDLLKVIQDKENELIAKTRENSYKVIEINKEVQNYLLSIEKHDKATSEISRLTQSLTGIDPKGIIGTVGNNIQSSIDKFYNN